MRALLLAVLTACGEVGDEVQVDATADIPGDGTAPPILRDTSEVEVALACPAPAFEGEAVIGRDDEAWCFESLEAGAQLAIVHGLQGGIHVELRLAITAASSGSPTTTLLEVDLVRDGTTLARFASGVVALEPIGSATPPIPGAAPRDAWASATFPVVFASADASLYHGVSAEVRARLVVSGREVVPPTVPVGLFDPARAAVPRR